MNKQTSRRTRCRADKNFTVNLRARKHAAVAAALEEASKIQLFLWAGGHPLEGGLEVS